jgi:LPXTG-site transpeptidase (sortase) family protein
MRLSSVFHVTSAGIALSLVLSFPLVFAPIAHAASNSIDFAVHPTSIFIPSIRMQAPIVQVGVNDKGEMAVPAGNTNAVGWYAQGTVPGNLGSAVLDAHVFAAFSNLSAIKPGGDIYVTQGSQLLHFVVQQVRTYALSDISPAMLFNRVDARRLNLITCAGTYIPALGTYDHRLVVYAQLVS